jgi:hypothetical protein
MSAEISNNTSAQPPTYEELQAERDLKVSFAQLLKDHEEIQRLFKSVSAQLESTPKIGEDHDLTREWNQLHKACYKTSLRYMQVFETISHRNTESCTEIHN